MMLSGVERWNLYGWLSKVVQIPGSSYPLVGIIMIVAFYDSLDLNPSPGELLVLDIFMLFCFSTPTLMKEK